MPHVFEVNAVYLLMITDKNPRSGSGNRLTLCSGKEQMERKIRQSLM